MSLFPKFQIPSHTPANSANPAKFTPDISKISRTSSPIAPQEHDEVASGERGSCPISTTEEPPTQETTPEAVATSILAENTTDEANLILQFWKQTFGMDLDRVRERSAMVGVSLHLKQLKKWEDGFKK